ncbi:MAG: Stk1 family PASTA domain-containing Ser/Thr kinase [Clostridia bacterium]|nr:Stk1 family PASTA domain-containing Ser/Thr kinase [Clostridia bacterium]
MNGIVIGNRYEIIEKIGAGGMAIVYKARCRLLNRFVAIKMLRAEFNDDVEFLKRFETEAQAAASLSHPNIVSVYDVGTHDKMHYIVMELVEGTTLKEYLQTKEHLSTEEIIDFSSQIASALEHAHSKKIIHHDIKPHNIIITDSGLLKVTDFGLARAVSATTTIANSGAIGSVHYSSPEQSRGGFTDEKSDIYSLGITMYEMATGVLPFDGDTPVAVAMKHLEKTPVRPKAYNPDLPDYIENIILKAMEKEPRNRYQSATELLLDLKTPEKAAEPQAKDDKFRTMVIPVVTHTEEEVVEEEQEEIKPQVKVKKRDTKPEKSPEQKKKDSVAVAAGIVTAVIIVAILGIIVSKIWGGGFEANSLKVPDFTNLSIEEAEILAKEKGFEIMADGEEYDEKIPEGYIKSQDPEADTPVKTAGKIKVIISLGPEGELLPDFRDWDKDKAIQELKRLGISYTFEEANDDKIEKDHIISTNPTAGTPIDDKTKVVLTVSLGEKKGKTAPNVLGRTRDEAEEILNDNSLKIGNVYQEEDSAPKGTIIRQSPVSGSAVMEGSSVDIVISKGKQAATTPSQPSENTENKTEESQNKTSGETESVLLIE